MRMEERRSELYGSSRKISIRTAFVKNVPSTDASDPNPTKLNNLSVTESSELLDGQKDVVFLYSISLAIFAL